MEWQEARLNSLQKLEPFSKKLSNCYELALLCDSELTKNWEKEISLLKNKLEKQIISLRKGEFHIAVVGLEKAGKSTVLNAFLNVDILPNDPERCTYTTTEIRAVRNISDQRVEIEFKNLSEFEEDKRGLEEICSKDFSSKEDKEKYTNDLDEIKSFEFKIKDCINKAFAENSKGIKSINFTNIKDIKNTIKPYIEGEKVDNNKKDTSKPRAVKKITLFTTELIGENELIMHDVPGWDSPVVLHQNLAKQKLSQADAILFVTSIADRVSLKGGESSMMEIASIEDPDIKVKDKVFVFLNKADGLDEPTELVSRYNSALKEWISTKNYCSKERIILGSARAYLTRIGEVNSRANEKLNLLSQEIKDLNFSVEIGNINDGIDLLRKKLELYLNNERTQILLKRCENLLNNLNKLVHEFSKDVNDKYPETDTKEIEENIHEANEITFKKWWLGDNEKGVKGEWEQVKEQFASWYYEQIIPQKNPDDESGINLKLKELQDKYNTKIDELGKSWILTDDEFRNLYIVATKFAPQPQQAHFKIREEIINKAYIEFEGIGKSIAEVTEEIINEILSWIKNRLFNIEKCSNLVKEKTTKQEKVIEFGTSALLTRFSRPTFEVFLRTPRGTGDRKNLLNYFKNDIQILQNFYIKGNKSKFELSKYLELGLWIASNIPEPTISNSSNVVRRILNANDLLGGNKSNTAQTEAGENVKIADNLEDIKKEITEDINSLVDYLKHSVFHASGIINFCYQEFNKLKEAFYSIEDKERLFEIYIKRELLNNKIPQYNHLLKKSENDILRKKKIINFKTDINL